MVAAELKKAGIQAEPYHAGLNDGSRTEIQERWINEHRCKVNITINITLLGYNIRGHQMFL